MADALLAVCDYVDAALGGFKASAQTEARSTGLNLKMGCPVDQCTANLIEALEHLDIPVRAS